LSNWVTLVGTVDLVAGRAAILDLALLPSRVTLDDTDDLVAGRAAILDLALLPS